MSFHMQKAVADGITCTTAELLSDDTDGDSKETSTMSAELKSKAHGSGARFVGELKPEEVRWFYKKTAQDKTWQPLNGRDSLAIESAYRRRSVSDQSQKSEETAASVDQQQYSTVEQPQSVVVFGGLYRLVYENDDQSDYTTSPDSGTTTTNNATDANKSSSTKEKTGYYLKPIYWEGSCLLLTRGTWFLETAGGDWQPLEADSAELAQKIESRHLGLFVNQRIPDKPLFFDKGPRPVLCEVTDPEEEKYPGTGARVRWHSVVDVILFNNSRSSRLWRYLKMTNAGTKLVRGYHTEAKMDDGPAPVNHLVFVIHGIGQKRQRNKIVTNTTSIREIADQLMRSNYPNSAFRPIFLPVDWRRELQLDEDLILSITPNYLEQIRGFFNETLMDLLYYASPRFGPEVIRGLCSVLNRIYRLYISNDPEFEARGGRVSLIAHSLGSVITYDILTSHWENTEFPSRADRISVMPQVNAPIARLDFPVENLFCFGSPLGVFLVARHRHGLSIIQPEESSGDTTPTEGVFRLHNIYHPADPVAYRVEPLISQVYANVRPLRIHRYNATDQPPYESIPAEIVPANVTSPRSRSSSPSICMGKENGGRYRPIGHGSESDDNASGFESDEGQSPSTAMVVQKTPVQENTAASPSPPPKRSWSAAVFGRFGVGRSESVKVTRAEVATVMDGERNGDTKEDDAIVEKAIEEAKEAVEGSSNGQKQSNGKAMAKEIKEKEKEKDQALEIPAEETLPYRVDFTLRQGRMEYAYWAAIVSHVSYWSNHDAVMYILSALYGTPKASAENK